MGIWHPLIGLTIGDKYRLLSVLGEGSFGGVFHAEELLPCQPPRAVAVKLILPHTLLSREQQVVELTAGVHLVHASIMRPFVAGICTLNRIEMLYLVMEEADQTLAQRLTDGPLPHEEVRSLAVRLADALCYLHQPPRRLVHCDVKPANILRVNGQWKLADFGIARLLGTDDATSGLPFGTPLYSPPEGMRGFITPAWDCWSLGMVLLESLTGKKPVCKADGRPVIHSRLLQPFKAIVHGCLHVDPDERWTAAQVRAALCDEQAPTTGQVSHNLPTPATSFIGREQEQQDVLHLLADDRLVTLTGTGGVGKTRLAVQAASSLLQRFPDGIRMAEFAPMRDQSLAGPTLAAALSISLNPGQAAVDAIVEFLRSRQMLLVLDNCEHLLASCAELAGAILRACPLARILATSREPLHIDEEVVYPTPALACPPAQRAVSPDELLHYDAVRLFVERARAVDPAFRLTAGNAAAVSGLCAHLDGIPLAIELAAARLQTFPVEQLAAHLHDRFRLLAFDEQAPMSHQQTLRVTLDWSHDLLAPDERILFRRLAIFTGGWTSEAAVGVCADAALPATSVPAQLDDLVAKSLVLRQSHGDSVRYGMLETIHQYATERLVEAGELAMMRERLAAYFLSVAEAPFPPMGCLDYDVIARVVHRLYPDTPNIRAVLHYFLDNSDKARAFRLLRLIWQGYNQGSTSLVTAREMLDLTDVAWKLPGALPPRVRAQAIIWVIQAAPGLREDDWAAMRALFYEALHCLEQEPDDWLRMWVLSVLAIRQSAHGEPEGWVNMRESVHIARTLNDIANLAAALGNQGRFALRENDLQLAWDSYAEGRELLYRREQEQQDRWYLAFTAQLARIADAMGRHDEAKALLEVEFDHVSTLPYAQELQMDFFTRLLWHYSREGNFALAQVKSADFLAQYADRQEFVESRIKVLGEMGKLAMARDDAREALDYFTRAAALSQTNMPAFARDLGRWTYHCADAERRLGRLDDARKHYLDGATIFESQTYPRKWEISMLSRCGLAMMATAEGDHATARAFMLEAIDIFIHQNQLFPAPLPETYPCMLLTDCAQLALACDDAEHAALLLAVTATRCPKGEQPVQIYHLREYHDTLAAVRTQLSPDAFAAAWEDGTRLSIEQGVEVAGEVLRRMG